MFQKAKGTIVLAQPLFFFYNTSTFTLTKSLSSCGLKKNAFPLMHMSEIKYMYGYKRPYFMALV